MFDWEIKNCLVVFRDSKFLLKMDRDTFVGGWAYNDQNYLDEYETMDKDWTNSGIVKGHYHKIN